MTTIRCVHLGGRALLAGAALTGLLALSGCDARSASNNPKPNIILIVIDTLRADHLGCYGYFRDTSPNIDAFADQSIFFEQAYAPMATTLPSHASLFTGLYPLEHGTVANFGDGGAPFTSRPGVRAAAEVFKENGYTTGAFVSAAPMKRISGINVGFDTYEQPAQMERGAKLTTAETLRWLDTHGKAPFFLFVHYFDPHTPYRPPQPYQTMFRHAPELDAHLAQRDIPNVVAPGLCRGRYPTVSRRAVNLYDGEIRYCDSQIGLLFEALKQRGLWDSSVIVLTADHGEGLNQHDWPQHGRTWNEQVHVPLMMRFPGRIPGRFAPLTSLIDVFPTVFGMLEADWAEDFLAQARGVNVLAADFQQRPLLAQRSARDCGEFGGPLYAYTTPSWRYHYTPDKPELLFDRRLDPYELNNAFDENSAEAGAIRRDLLSEVADLLERGKALEPTATETTIDPQYRRDMEALGYVDSLDDDEQVATQPASAPSAP